MATVDPVTRPTSDPLTNSSRADRRVLALLVVAGVLLVACSSEPSPAATSESASSPTPVAPPAPVDSVAPTTQVAPTVPAAETPSTSTVAATSTLADTSPSPAAVELAPAAEPVGTVVHDTISVGGQERTYRLYVPTNLAAGAVPLFIGLHGGTGWGDQFAQTNHVEGLAESNGFIVVHPDGVKMSGGPGGVWNGGVCCGAAARDGVDDVAFIDALIDELEVSYSIDEDRVYAFGHSNGGIMSYRLACELADRVVGIGVVAGTLGVDACSPSEPVSVIHVHGTADTNLPLAGGVGPDSIAGVDFPVPREGFDQMAARQGCSSPTSSAVGDVTTDRSEPCSGGATMEFVTIDSATHAWPGGTPIRTPASGAGYAGYDATSEIVAFLLAHPRA